MSNDLGSILSFLTALHNRGKSFSTVNIHRSMLSMTLDPIESIAIGSHPLVIRLLKGCYNSNPPSPRYTSIWNVQAVLDFMRRGEDNISLSIPLLTRKLATLLAISSLLRVSELASLSREVRFTATEVHLSLLKPRKTQFSGPLREVSLSSFAEKIVCPIDCLRVYLFFTDFYRNANNEKFLFVSLVHPFGPVTGNTVGRWIKTFLKEAGVDTSVFSAHSTRGAAASSAANSGIPIDAILRAGDWSRESTFSRFYHRSL